MSRQIRKQQFLDECLNDLNEDSSVFPKSQTQICVVRQIRNAWKNRTQFTADMKLNHNATTKQAAELALKDFTDKWENKYFYALKSWHYNRKKLTVFFDFPIAIPKIIYATI